MEGVLKIYIAASFGQRDLVRQYTKELRKLGHELTNTWQRERTLPMKNVENILHWKHMEQRSKKRNINIAERDLEDLLKAETLILLTQPQRKEPRRAGRHVEFGIAAGRGLRLIVCGPPVNVFHYLPEVEQFNTWDELKEALSETTA